MKKYDFEGRRVLVVSLLPDTGHLTPLLQIGNNLQRENAQVLVIAPEEASRLVKRFNVALTPLRPVVPAQGRRALERLSDAGDWSRLLWYVANFNEQYILPSTINGIEQLDSLIQYGRAFDPHLILADTHLFSDEYRELAATLQVPLVLHYSKGNQFYLQSEDVWSSHRSSLAMAVRRFIRKVMPPLRFKARKVFAKKKRKRLFEMQQTIREKRLGYQYPETVAPPVTEITTGIARLEEAYLGDLIKTWGDRVIQLGPLAPDPDWGDHFDLKAWLDNEQDSPTIYIAFGTMIKPPYQRIAAMIHHILSEGGRVVLATPERPPSLSRENNNRIWWGPWVPQSAVLSHPAVQGFITHAGATSVQEALWFGKPMLCMPRLWDQFYSAWVAEQMGFGIWADGIASQKQPLRKKVARLMNDSALYEKAQQLSRELRSQKGDTAVVETLFRVMNGEKNEKCKVRD